VIGTGSPTAGNARVARMANPEARVACADDDSIVLTRASRARSRPPRR
jgi:hypothetical protein